MPLDLDTHMAPRCPPKPKLELPPVVRDYLERVRGSPEMNVGIVPAYLDNLWKEAVDFAKRNGVPCPVHREELDALRDLVETRTAGPQTAHRALCC